jgi:ectoine hydroxylase-related dioxygenase (phytanoyl-CoA dioxygenase family)
MKQIPHFINFINNHAYYSKYFKNNGYILIKNVFDYSDFNQINNMIFENSKKYLNIKKKTSLDEEKYNKILINLRKKSPKKFALFYDTLQTTTSQIKFWTGKKILKIATTLIGCKYETLSATDFLIRIDSPIDERNKLDWHQDSSYFRQNKYGHNGLNCWTPLTDLKFNMGPLEFLEKSHKNGCYKVGKSRNLNFGSLQRRLSKKITKKFKLKKFEMELGDVLFMNMDTMHRSGSNFSKIFRFSSICRYHNTMSMDFNPGINLYKYSNKKINKEVHGF